MAYHRVFCIAELLDLIVAQCDNASLARLARSSQFLFDIAVPLLWENLQGVHKILFLVPGAVIGQARQSDPPLKAPPLLLGAVDFTRFNIYASHVRNLAIYDPVDAKRHIVTYYNWPFIHYLSQLRLLLPKLNILTMSHARGNVNPMYEQWITALASRELNAVYSPLIAAPGLLPYPPSIPLVAAVTVTTRLVRKSPSLQVLEIYPIASSAELNTIDHPAACAESSMPDAYGTPYQKFCVSFEGLKSLHKLAITAIAFETNIFRALANLPCLESLTIHSTSYQLPEFHPGPVSPSSFPVLTRLSLIDIDHANLERAWESAPLVQKLCSLNVRWSYSGHTPAGWVRETFLPLLRARSPNLEEFLCESCRPGGVTEVVFSMGLADLR